MIVWLKIRRWAAHVRAFLSLIHMLWVMVSMLAETNAQVKSTAAEANVAALANEINHITGLGLPSPGTPGGGPSVYTPSYESQMSACLQSVIDKLHNAGIL